MNKSIWAMAIIISVAVGGIFVLTGDSDDVEADTTTYTDGDWTFIVNEDGASATITKFNGTNAFIINVPSAVSDGTTTYPVTALDGGTSYPYVPVFNNTSVAQGGAVTFPNTLTRLGTYVFNGCTNLQMSGDLNLPSSLTYIGHRAFGGCTGLYGSLVLPDNVTYIGSWSFYGCGFTSTLTLPSSVQTIEVSAFGNCQFHGSLVIPNSVTTIGASAFSGCTGFTGSLTIPNSVTTIGASAFSGCTGFDGTLTLSSSLTAIPDSAFRMCGFTGSLTIPNAVTSIGQEAFRGCSGFTGSLTIPNTVTSIGSMAFYNCSGFTSLSLPNTITSISADTFNGCSGFTGTLTIPSGVTSIGNSAFYGCSGFTGSLVIPSGVTSIGNRAFERCSGFNGSLVIPSGVTSIGSEVFSYCSGFIGTLTIPSGVTSIGNNAFERCSGFTSLVIPSGVTSIGNSAFYGCSGFTGTLTLPESLTTIGSMAFRDCSGFTGVLEIPYGLTSIASGAFNGCSGFSALILPSTVTTITTGTSPYEYTNSFYGCTNLATVYNASALDIQKDTNNGYAGYYATDIYQCHTVFITSNNSDYGYPSKPELVIMDGDYLMASSDEISTTVPNQSSRAMPYPGCSFMDYTYDSGPITMDTYVTANFQPPTYYTISIEVAHSSEYGSVSQQSVTVIEGTLISTNGDRLTIGSTVIVASPNPRTDYYTYSFLNWSDVPSSVMGNDTIYANFEAVENEYTVTIRSNDENMGTVSDTSVSVPYGTTYSASGDVLTIGSFTIYATVMPESTESVYSLREWSPSSGTITDNTTEITAMFQSSPRPYSVHFSSDNPTYGTVSESEITAYYGDSISVSGSSFTVGSNSPVTATPTTVGAYEFIYWEWYPSDSTIMGETYVTAHFVVVTKTVNVESNNISYGSVEILGQAMDYVEVPYGTTFYVYNGELHIGSYTATATAEPSTYDYDYAFTGWSPSSGTVTDNMTIYANFSVTAIVWRNVTILVNDSEYGSVSPSSLTVRNGSSISAQGNELTIGTDRVVATPSDRTDEYSYIFNYWSRTSGTITSDSTILATFERTINTYTVSFIEVNGEYGYITRDGYTVSSISVQYGSTITSSVVNGVPRLTFQRAQAVSVEAHILADNDQWDYSFDGWSPDTGTVRGNMDITVSFSRALQQYNVTFTVSPSGYGSVSRADILVPYGTTYSVNQSGELEIYGETISAQPTQADETYFYTFTGWSPSSGTVTNASTATIQANFEQNYVPYTVYFEVSPAGSGTVDHQSVTVHYNTYFYAEGDQIHIGDMIVTATPSDPTAEYRYVFNSWSESSGNITDASGTTITANIDVVDVVYTVYIQVNNSDYGHVTRDEVSVRYNTPYSVEGNKLTIGVYEIYANAEIDTAQYDYEFQSWDVTSGFVTSSGWAITATFTATLRWYDVTFAVSPSGYGSVDIASVEGNTLHVPYGTSVSLGNNPNELNVGDVLVTATPVDGYPQYVYSFVNWSGASATVEADMPIVANFSRVTAQYLVHFSVKSGDSDYGHIESTTSAYYAYYGTTFTVNGNRISFDGHTVEAVPTTSDERDTYTFVGWDGVPNSVVEETFIEADFDHFITKHRVDFVPTSSWGNVSVSYLMVDYGTSYYAQDDEMIFGSDRVTATPLADNERYDYGFSGWTPSSGTIEGPTTIQVVFTRDDIYYTVTIQSNDTTMGTVSQSTVSVLYDTSYSVNGTTLTIGSTEVYAYPSDPTEAYIYVLEEWDPSSGRITDNSTIIHANFGWVYHEYTVTITSNNSDYGYVDPRTVEVPYGSSISASGDVLSIGEETVTAYVNEPTVAYTYVFIEWQYESSTVTREMDITARFDYVVNKYDVTIVADNPDYGTISANTVNADYGSEITIHGARISIGGSSVTAQANPRYQMYDYTFDGWTTSTPTVSPNTVVTAHFSRILAEYTLTFRSANTDYGTVDLRTLPVHYNTSVTISDNQLVIGSTTVTATPKSSFQYIYSFTGWTMGGSEVSDTVTITDDSTFVANFDYEIRYYKVTIVSNNTNWGTVDTSPVYVQYEASVSSDGNRLYVGGYTITANHASETQRYRYSFSDWSMSSGTITEDNTTITARFERTIIGYEVYFAPDSELRYGTVTPSSMIVPINAPFTVNDNQISINNQTVTATPFQDTPQYDYTFMGWSTDSGTVYEDGMRITASFSRELAQYQVFFLSNNSEMGSVSESELRLPYGTEITPVEDTLQIIGPEMSSLVSATVMPSTEAYTYVFEAWTLNDVPITSTIEVQGTLTIYAKFAPLLNYYTITVLVNNSDYGYVDPRTVEVPYGSSISASGDVLSIGEETVTAYVNEPTVAYTYVFIEWQYESSTVTREMDITARFDYVVNKYDVTIVADNPDYGTISANTVNADYGSEITIHGARISIGGSSVTAQANPRYQMYDYTFDGWTTSTPTVSPNTVVTAHFSRILAEYTLTFRSANTDYGTVDLRTLPVHYNTSVTISDNQLVIGSTTVTATPKSSFQYIYSFTGWTMGGSEVSDTVTITDDSTFVANFDYEIRYYKVTIVSNNTNWGTVDTSPVYVQYEASVSSDGNRLYVGGYTITANHASETQRYRYSFSDWSMSSGTITEDNTTITARFERTIIGYEVYFAPDSELRYGTVTPSSMIVPINAPFTVNDNQISINNQTVTATPFQDTPQYDYTFMGWSTDSGTVYEDGMTIYAYISRSVIAYLVTIESSNPNYGTVDDDSEIVDYGTQVSASLNTLLVGSVLVTASHKDSTVKYEYTFDGWSANGTDISDGSTIEITGDTTIVAKFSRTVLTCIVTISVVQDGWGIVSSTEEIVAPGTEITSERNVLDIGEVQVTATPHEDTPNYTYYFDYWDIPSYIVEDDMTVYASFGRDVREYIVTFAPRNPAMGSVTKDWLSLPYGTLIIPVGNALTISNQLITTSVHANPAPQSDEFEYIFDKWTYNNQTLTTNITVEGTMDIYAHFDSVVRAYTVFIEIRTPEWGSVSTEIVNNVKYGTTLTAEGPVLHVGSTDVTATPAGNTEVYEYSFDRWSVIEGEPQTVQGDKPVYVYFARTAVKYLVTFTVDPSGWGTVNNLATVTVPVDYGTTYYAEGDQIRIGDDTIFAKPTDKTERYEYRFMRWSDTAGTITHATTITAMFDRDTIQYIVTIIKNENYGTISKTSVPVEYDTPMSVADNVLTIGSTSVTARAYDRNAQYTYHFDRWGGVVPTVTSDIQITAIFSRTVNQYTVSFESSNPEWGSVDVQSIPAPYGSAITIYGDKISIVGQTVTATPADPSGPISYDFAGWLNVTPTVTQTMTIIADFRPTSTECTVSFTVTDGRGTWSQSQVNVPYDTDIQTFNNIVAVGSVYVVFLVSQDSEYTDYVLRGFDGIPADGKVKSNLTIGADVAVYKVMPGFNIIQPKEGDTSVQENTGPEWLLVSIAPVFVIFGLMLVAIRFMTRHINRGEDSEYDE